MNTIKFYKAEALVIAHRGLSGLEPENSIPAFIAAANRSYYGIETDVHVTKDGKFVLTHDDHTERVANGNLHIEESSYDEIRKLKLHNLGKLEILDGKTPNDVTERPDLNIPNLEEYINVCKKYNKKAVLELKNTFPPEYVRKLLTSIEEMGYMEHMIFISFSQKNMMYLRELLPNHTLQYLKSSYDETVLEFLNKYHLDFDVYHEALTKEVIDELHANGHKVNAWTVDSAERAEELISWGIDFITTNILE